MISSKNLRLSMLLFTLWYIVSYVYYGLIYILPTVYQKLALTEKKSDKLDSKLYDQIVSDIIISCIFEFPSNILNGILPYFFEKRKIIIFAFLGSGIFSFLSCFMTYSIPLYSSINKAFINTAFSVLYIYTSEVFPTYMRATSLGTCNFFSRIGGFTTPFICEFLVKISFVTPFLGFCMASTAGLFLTMLLDDISGKCIF